MGLSGMLTSRINLRPLRLQFPQEGATAGRKKSVASYEGSLRIPNTHDVVAAVFEIDAETMSVTAGSEVLGSWPLSEVTVEDRGDALLVSLSGESVLVEVPDRSGFSSALKPTRDRRSQRKKRRRPPKQPAAQAGPPARSPQRRSAPVEPVEPDPIELVDAPALVATDKPSLGERLRAVGAILSVDSWRAWLQDPTVRWTIAAMGVVIFAMLALFATDTLGMLLVLVGMVALIIAALAASEDINAYRMIPSAISETSLVIGGATALVIGALLILLS